MALHLYSRPELAQWERVKKWFFSGGRSSFFLFFPAPSCLYRWAPRREIASCKKKPGAGGSVGQAARRLQKGLLPFFFPFLFLKLSRYQLVSALAAGDGSAGGRWRESRRLRGGLVRIMAYCSLRRCGRCGAKPDFARPLKKSARYFCSTGAGRNYAGPAGC